MAKARMSAIKTVPQERTLREQVAACTLLLNDLGLLGYSGHVSARLPGRDAFLIQSFDQSRASLKPSDLLICDFDGRTLKVRRACGRRPRCSCIAGSCGRGRTSIQSRTSITS